MTQIIFDHKKRERERERERVLNFPYIFFFIFPEMDTTDKLRHNRRHRWESLINILRMIKKPSWPRMSLYNGSASLFYRANRFTIEVKIVTAVLWFLW